MDHNLNSFLKKISNTPELKNNLFAWLLATYDSIDLSNRDKLFSSVFPLYQKHYGEQIEPIAYTEEYYEDEINTTDFRIKKISFSNVRGFPSSDKPYGIDFTESGLPKSAVLLGANGVGKSSIFTSLEYIFGGEIGEAKLRNQDDPIEYLKRFNSKYETSVFTVNTISGNYTFQDPISKIQSILSVNPGSHFISDYDIYKNGKINFSGNPTESSSFHYLIASSLGLQELLDFNEVINKLSTYKRTKEKNKLRELLNDKTKFEDEIKTWNKVIEETEDKINKFNKSTSEAKSDKKDDKNLSLLELINNKASEKINFQFDLKKLKDIIETYYLEYIEFKDIVIDVYNQNEIEFLNLGLKLIEQHNYLDCPFCKNSKSPIEKIKSGIIYKTKAYSSYSEKYKSLSNLFNIITEGIESVYSKCRIILDHIEKESSQISPYQELYGLLEKEREFLDYWKNRISNDFFLNIIRLNSSQDTMRFRLKSLYTIIESNLDQLENILFVQQIQEFNSVRDEFFEKATASIKEKIQSKTGSEELAILKNETKKLKEQIDKNKNLINKYNSDIEQINTQIDYFSRLIEDALSYRTVVSNSINETVNKYFEPIKDITISILSDYLKYDDVQINIEREPLVDSETGEIISEIIKATLINEEKGITISPNKYFNTFRYRLFCMMVSVSIAIASRVKTQLNFPIILDDVFYASDFLKRASIEKFLLSLTSAFEKYSKDLPLQLIIFTHDELIFDSAISALNRDDENENFLFLKLLHYQEADDKEDYKELTYKIPSNIPESIMHILNF